MSSFSLPFLFLKKFSARKALNAGQLLAGYYYSRMSGRPVLWGLPVSMAIEPTTSCNLRCPECPSGESEFTRPTGMLEKKFFERMIDETASHLSYLTFYFQGEPYLNPDFLSMVQYAGNRGIFTSSST